MDCIFISPIVPPLNLGWEGGVQMHQCCVLFSRSLVGLGGEGFCLSVLNYVLLNQHSWGGRLQLEEPEAWATVLSPFWASVYGHVKLSQDHVREL